MAARTAFLAALALAMAGAAQAAPQYSAVYAFGDSLSDAGNLFLLSSNPANGVPNQPLAPYSQGRFTNGNTWVQDLSLLLGNGPLAASLAGGTDYAYGGARTGTTLTGAANFIDLPSQLAQFESTHATAPSTALYTLSIGANDIFGLLAAVGTGALSVAQAETGVAQAAQNTADAAAALHGLGAQHLVLYDVPDLATTPAFRAYGALATKLTQDFDAAVATDLAPVEAAGLRVDVLGEYARQAALLADPAAFGFTDVADPCWTGGYQGPTLGATLCSATAAGQDQYLFWDRVHPTEAAHLLIAEDALNAVPEPASLALLAAGALGMWGVRRRAA